MIDTAWTIYKLSVPCREQIFFFSFGTSPFPTPPMVLLITALRRIGRGIYSKLFEGAFFVGLMLWDLSLTTINLLTFKRKIGHVTPKGMPGEGGVWPQYIPPRDGDSRCSCPALNAMANHGPYFVIASTLCPPFCLKFEGVTDGSRSPPFISETPLPFPPPGLIPRDGRNITFRELSMSIRSTYNFAPSFCLYVPRYIATVLNRSYNAGRFDLSDIDVHNGIEHDASLVRK
jgi:hypothetical protein